MQSGRAMVSRVVGFLLCTFLVIGVGLMGMDRRYCVNDLSMRSKRAYCIYGLELPWRAEYSDTQYSKWLIDNGIEWADDKWVAMSIEPLIWESGSVCAYKSPVSVVIDIAKSEINANTNGSNVIGELRKIRNMADMNAFQHSDIYGRWISNRMNDARIKL